MKFIVFFNASNDSMHTLRIFITPSIFKDYEVNCFKVIILSCNIFKVSRDGVDASKYIDMHTNCCTHTNTYTHEITCSRLLNTCE